MKNVKVLTKKASSVQGIEILKSKMKLVCASKIHVISKSEIVYLKSDSNYCHVVLANGKKITCSQTLKSISAKLHDNTFFRPHQSFVFNMNYLETVNTSMTELCLLGGICIPISRVNRAVLRQRLDVWFD